MRLRTRLYLLVAGTVIPLAILAVVLGAMLVDHERDTFQRLAMDRNRAFLTAVDSELNGHITSLMAISAISHLGTGDLRAFHSEIARILKTQRDWDNIIL